MSLTPRNSPRPRAVPHRMVNVRKLAAVDLLLLGPRVVLPEFVIGVVLPAGLGVWGLIHSRGRSLLMAYLVSLGLNYVPLLIQAIRLARAGSAQTALLEESREALHAYRFQQLWILVPLAVVAASIRQALSRRRR